MEGQMGAWDPSVAGRAGIRVRRLDQTVRQSRKAAIVRRRLLRIHSLMKDEVGAARNRTRCREPKQGLQVWIRLLVALVE